MKLLKLYSWCSYSSGTWIECVIVVFFSCKQKHLHKDKVPHEEEEAGKDPSVRKAIKAAAAEVENAEGRGQIKVRDEDWIEYSAVFENSDV